MSLSSSTADLQPSGTRVRHLLHPFSWPVRPLSLLFTAILLLFPLAAGAQSASDAARLGQFRILNQSTSDASIRVLVALDGVQPSAEVRVLAVQPLERSPRRGPGEELQPGLVRLPVGVAAAGKSGGARGETRLGAIVQETPATAIGSGTSLYEAVVPRPRLSSAGSLELIVEVRQPGGDTVFLPANESLEGISATAASDPGLGTVTISPAQVDITDTFGMFAVDAVLTDPVSPITLAMFSLVHSGTGRSEAAFATLTSGSEQNGTWHADITMPRYSATGTWDLQITVFTASVGAAVLDPNKSVQVTGTSDLEPPALAGDPTVSPAVVDLSSGAATVTASVPMSDNLSGVQSVYIYLASGNESVYSWFSSLVSGTATSGVWEAEIEIPQNTPSGSWTLYVDAVDVAGNYIDDLRTTASVEITGGEITAPVLAGTATISPSGVDVSAGPEMVTVTIPLRDEDPGVDYLTPYFINGEEQIWGYDAIELISGDIFDGTWRTEIEIPQSAADGSWQLWVYAEDLAGNVAEFNTGQVLAVGGGDAQAPTLSGTPIIEPNRVNLAAGSATVSVSAVLRDNDTGVDYVYFEFRSASGSFGSSQAELISGDAMEGTWRADVEVPANATPGPWTLHVYAQDAVDNGAILSTQQTLTVEDSDVSAPTLSGTPELSPTSVDLTAGAAIITVTARLLDNRAGVNYVSFSLRSGFANISGRGGLVDGDSLDGTWRGEIEVPANTPPGVWVLDIKAEDAAGNAVTLRTQQSLTIDAADVSAPELVSTPTVAPSSVDLSAGSATVTVRASVRDDISGVARVHATFVKEGAFGRGAEASLVSGTNVEGMWEAAVDIPQQTTSGEWTLRMTTTDAAGNTQTHDTGVLLQIAAGDVVGPEISGTVSLSPSAVDLTGGDQTVTITAPITDAGSGVSSVQAALVGPSEQRAIYFSKADLISGTDRQGVWEITVTIGQSTPPGRYEVVLDLFDRAYNYAQRETGAAIDVGIQLPGQVAEPFPADGENGVPVQPGFESKPASGAVRYDLFLWRSGDAAPGEPTAADLSFPQHFVRSPLAAGTDYNWRVDAKNSSGTTPGPVWQFTTAELPDLVVTDIQAPSSAIRGSLTEIRWTITNTGPVGTSVPQWYDIVYLSGDENASPADDARLLLAPNVSYLGPGESYVNTQQFSLPMKRFGSLYLVVEANAGLVQSEANTQNNVRAVPIKVDLGPAPDLTIKSFSVPEHAFSGREVEVSWVLENAGDGAAVGLWEDHAYLSRDSLISAEAILDKVRLRFTRRGHLDLQVGRLEPGESFTSRVSLAIPDSLSGELYVIVVLDQNDEMFEPFGEFNNTRRAVLPVTLAPPPDLVVTSVEGPRTAGSGERIELSWTVENQGAGPITSSVTRPRSWSDRIYVSRNATWDPAEAVIIGTHTHYGALDAGATYTKKESVVLPDGADGPYYFFVWTDWESKVYEFTFDNNNRGRSALATQIALSPWPDLVPSAPEAPSHARAGDEITVSWSVQNAGVARAVATWQDSVYVSTESSWDRSKAQWVGMYRRTDGLDPGAQYTGSARLRLPIGLSGDLYLYTVADASRTIYEHTDEQNNVARSRAIQTTPYPGADIEVVSMEVPSSLSSGQRVTVRYEVSNSGVGRTLSERWTDGIYLSRNETFEPFSDQELASVTRVGALAGAQRYSVEKEVRLPHGISGSYHVLVVSDSRELVQDNDRSNNVRSSGVISVQLAAPADLIVSQVSPPATLTAGQPATIGWTIRNAGQGPTADSLWYDVLYLSPTASLGPQSIRLVTEARRGTLAAGESYQHTSTVHLPVHASGAQYLLAVTDSRDQVYEHGRDDNNTNMLQATVEQLPPSDLIVSAVTVPPRAVSGERVDVAWTLRNQGTNPARGRLTTGIYFSKDATWDIGDALLGLVTQDIDLEPGGSVAAKAQVDPGTVLQADSTGSISGHLPGLAPGRYYAIVRADVRNNIRETDEQNNDRASDSTLEVDVPLLPLDVPITAAWDSRSDHYYRIDVGADLDLRVTLEQQATFTGGLFSSYAGVPSLSSYEHRDNQPGMPRRRLVVPSTKAGPYYVLLRHDYAWASKQYTVLAEALSFAVLEVEPARGGQGQVTARVSGAGFRPQSRVFLRGSAGDVAEAEVIDVPHTAEMVVRWQLADVPLGTYTVVARNADGSEAVLEQGFTVEPTKPAGLLLLRNDRDQLLINRPSTFIYQFRNTSNVDLPYAYVMLGVPAMSQVSVRTDGRLRTRSMLAETEPEESRTNIADYFDQGDVRFIPLIAHNITVGERLEVSLTVVPVTNELGDYPVRIHWQVQDLESFLAFQLERIELARSVILSNRSRMAAPVVALAEDRQAFTRFVLSGLRDLGLLQASMLDDAVERMLQMTPSGMAVAPGKIPQLMTGPGIELMAGNPLCEAFFMITGCAAAILDCFVEIPVPGLGAVLCVVGIAGCFGIDTGFAGCLGPLSILNCLGKELLCKQLLGSMDPNDILGPEGYGDRRWVSVNETLDYTVRFENDPQLATAPAQVVRVDVPLDSTLDARSFRLGAYGFGGYTFEVPANTAAYQTRLDLRDSLGVFVDVDAGLDIQGGRAFWVFRAVDPTTGMLPADPFHGILPVNDSLGRGEGFVTFRVRPDAQDQTGDVINARARIVFDVNEPIDTPPIYNTVDAGMPQSYSVRIADGVLPNQATLSWSGRDDAGGSGLRDFTLYVSEDGEAFRPHQGGLSDTSLVFVGEPDRRYRFFLLASDNTGNLEVMKDAAEGEFSTSIASDIELPREYALYQNYPNPFNPMTTITFDLVHSGPVSLRLYDVLGRRVLDESLGTMMPGRHAQQFNFGHLASGVYFYELVVQSERATVFRDVRKLVLVK